MESQGLLADLTVIEFANVLAGPATGMFLAEQGARVIKVENPATGGDPTRGWTLPGETPADGISGYFACTNWGKESVLVDLSQPEGRALAAELASQADVVLQSFKPGDERRFGVDEATLRHHNPKLIYGAVSAYGPADSRPGFDALIQAEAGFTFLNGDPDGQPTKMPVALMDLLAAHQLKEAVLLALLRRERTGQGSSIHVSLVQAAVAALANQATNWLMGGRIPQRMGSAHPNVVPYGTLYASADGDWFVLAVGTDRQFAALCRALGREAWSQDARFARNSARVGNRETLDALLSQRCAEFSTPALQAALASERVPHGPVNDMAAVFAQPSAADCILEGNARNGVVTRAVRTATFQADMPSTTPTPPPPLGADTCAVLRSLLACPEERLQALLNAGIIEDGGTSQREADAAAGTPRDASAG